MEPEHYADLLSRIRDVWHRAASIHGGLVFRTQGDGALIVFGYPQSREDDSRRAVEVALDIHEDVRELQVDGLPANAMPLEMHSGIHGGMALMTEGDLERGRFDLIGDVVNTAAHLEKSAAPGQILASLQSLGPHANFFELGDDPRSKTERSEQASCVQIIRRRAVTRRFDASALRGLTPFIGRGEITNDLRDYLSAGQVQRQRCLIVVGNAGLGKTRLLEELSQLQEVSRFMLLRGGCENYLEAEALQPFVQMLRACVGRDREIANADAVSTAEVASHPSLEELGIPVDALLGLISSEAEISIGRSSASGIIGDLIEFFSAMSSKVPLLMMIDDWQWADDASRQLLEALLQLPVGPLVILASRPRDDEADWITDATHLTLSPFREQETSVAVRRWLPEVDPFLAAQIHAYAGGVPLFVEELCHSASANTLSEELQGRGATQTWLAALVASRLGRLPPKQASVVRAAAVIGNVVPKWLLEKACDEPPSITTLQALADADFLYPDDPVGVLRFKHGITRDAAYEAIGVDERTSLHQRIETALLSGPGESNYEEMLEALAYHSRGAGNWKRAAQYAERAGDKATAAFALDLARAQYQAAMEALDRVPDATREQSLRWCTLANKLGMTCIFDPLALRDDLTVFERAVALARDLDDDNALARSQYWLGYICYGFGRFHEGVAHARQAVELARKSGDAPLAAQIEASLGQALAATCNYDEAIALLETAVDTKRRRSRPGGGVAIGSAYALSCKGSVLADRGNFDGAHNCFDEALLLLDGSTHPVGNSVRNWIAVALVWQGRWQEAEHVAVESARIAENTRGLLLLAVSRAVAGYTLWAGSGKAEGLDQLRDAVSWIETRRGRFYTSLHYGWLVEACVTDGHIEEARKYAARTLRRSRQGERLGEAVSCRAMAIAAARDNELLSVERWMQRAEESARIRGSGREAALNQVARGRILEWQGHADTGRRLIETASTELRSFGMEWHAEQTKENLLLLQR